MAKSSKIRITKPSGKSSSKQTKAAISAARKSVQANAKAARDRVSKQLKDARRRVKELEAEHARLERLLGETFETVKEARAALKATQTVSESVAKVLRSRYKKQRAKEREAEALRKAARKAEKEAKKAAPFIGQKPIEPIDKDALPPIELPFTPRKKVFTFGELTKAQKKTITKLLLDRETTYDLNKALNLKPGESLAAMVPYEYKDEFGNIRVGYAKTYDVFPNLNSLFNKLTGYSASIKASEATIAKWLERIKIVRTTLTNDEWRAKTNAEAAEREQKKLARRKRKFERERKKKGK